MIINEDGDNVYYTDLDTVEKIEKFKPRFYTETVKLKIVKETKKNYIVVGTDENGREEETYISKIQTYEDITLNSPIYPNMKSDRLDCLLYTLDDPKEIVKGKEVVLEYFTKQFNIEMARHKKAIETLEKNFFNKN
jgi:hypothetical protein